MRECGNVRTARCPPGLAHAAPCLDAAFLLAPGGRGLKRVLGEGRLSGHMGLGSNGREAAEGGDASWWFCDDW